MDFVSDLFFRNKKQWRRSWENTVLSMADMEGWLNGLILAIPFGVNFLLLNGGCSLRDRGNVLFKTAVGCAARCRPAAGIGRMVVRYYNLARCMVVSSTKMASLQKSGSHHDRFREGWVPSWQGPVFFQICSPEFGRDEPNLGGGFKHFLCSPLFGEMIPIRLIFFKWVETTNQKLI